MKTRTEYSILNIITGLGGYTINTLLGLICRMVFTRTLAVDYLGISGLFTNILSMLGLAELGIGSAIVYALYKPLAENNQEKVASLVKFYGNCYRAIGTFIASVGLMLMPFLDFIIIEPPAINENLYLIYLFYLFNTASTYFFSYRSSLIMAAQQNYIVTGISYLVSIVQSIFQMLWLFVTHIYIGYLIIQTIGTFIYNVTISYIAKYKFPYIAKRNIEPLEKEEKQGLIRNVRALVIWKVSGMLVNGTDNIIITFFSGLKAVGLSSNYTLLSTTLNALLNQLFYGITASVGNLNAVESKAKKMELFYAINLTNFWLFGWASIGIFVVSTDVVSLMFGETYILPLNIPFVIALNFYMVGMQNAVWTFKNTMGLFRPGRYLLMVTAIINLVCSIVLGKIWGLFGILFATAISRVLTNAWYDPYAVFKYGFQEKSGVYFKRYFIYALILMGTGGICFGICSFIHINIWMNVVIKFLICCIIPNMIFTICFYQLLEFQYLLGFAKRLKSKAVQKIKR